MTRANDLFGQVQQRLNAITPDTVNHAGYGAFTKDVEDRYIQMLMTNTMGNTYYAGQQENVETSMNLHKEMLAKDPSFMAKAVVYARNNGFTRLQPIIGLAFLSTAEDKTLFHAAFGKVIYTPNNLFDFVTIASNIRSGKGFGRTVKRAIGNWYNSLSEYHVMKYGAESKVDGKTGAKSFDMKDVLKLVRPVPATSKQKELFKYILNKEVSFASLPQLGAYEAMKRETDMGKVRDLIAQARIPHEVATGAISRPDKETWTFIMKQMPIFALLRNLNTLERHGVFDELENRNHAISLLTNENAVTKSKILPYRFLTAFEMYQGHTDIRDAIRTAINLSFSNVPTIVGTTHVSIDKSGSMSGDRIKQAAIFGAATFLKAPDAEITMFDTMLYTPDISRQDSLMTNVAKLPGAGGGTALSLPVLHLLGKVTAGTTEAGGWFRTQTGYHSSVHQLNRRNQATKVDNIVIVTDEQQNADTPLVTAFNEYRRTVNPGAKLFIINVAGYDKHSTPKEDPNIFHIFGWSDQVIQYVSYVSHGFAGQRQHVDSVDVFEDTKVLSK
jgi:60 kDa SS-A/Ro ribonucleoprotein